MSEPIRGELVPFESTALTESRPGAPSGGVEIGNGLVATLGDVMNLAKQMAGAMTLPEGFRKAPDITVAALKAAQWRMPLMAVIDGCHNIKGKVSPGADLMAGIARGSGSVAEWNEGETEDGKGYRVHARRKDGTSLTVTFTLDDAKRAGLSGGNWASFPMDMLRARAVSRLCRRLFPDVLAGTYSAEEMEDVTPAAVPPVDTQPEPDADEAPPVGTPDATRRKARALIRDLDKALEAGDRQVVGAAVTALRDYANAEGEAGRLSVDSQTGQAVRAALDEAIAWAKAAPAVDPFDDPDDETVDESPDAE